MEYVECPACGEIRPEYPSSDCCSDDESRAIAQGRAMLAAGADLGEACRLARLIDPGLSLREALDAMRPHGTQ